MHDERKIVVRMYKLARKAFAKFRWKRLWGARGSKEETKKRKKKKELFVCCLFVSYLFRVGHSTDMYSLLQENLLGGKKESVSRSYVHVC